MRLVRDYLHRSIPVFNIIFGILKIRLTFSELGQANVSITNYEEYTDIMISRLKFRKGL